VTPHSDATAPVRDGTRAGAVSPIRPARSIIGAMRTGLSVDDLGDLPERPLLAVLATRNARGEVLLSPVWHEWRDGGFSVFTGANDVKVRHVRVDPRVSIVVCEQSPPYRGIEVRGDARIDADPDEATRRRIAARYIGEEGAGAWVGPEDVILRVEPGALRAWDFVDDYPDA
jgi:PPOX class probable F420-dependent enzyme